MSRNLYRVGVAYAAQSSVVVKRSFMCDTVEGALREMRRYGSNALQRWNSINGWRTIYYEKDGDTYQLPPG